MTIWVPSLGPIFQQNSTGPAPPNPSIGLFDFPRVGCPIVPADDQLGPSKFADAEDVGEALEAEFRPLIDPGDTFVLNGFDPGAVVQADPIAGPYPVYDNTLVIDGFYAGNVIPAVSFHNEASFPPNFTQPTPVDPTPGIPICVEFLPQPVPELWLSYWQSIDIPIADAFIPGFSLVCDFAPTEVPPNDQVEDCLTEGFCIPSEQVGVPVPSDPSVFDANTEGFCEPAELVGNPVPVDLQLEDAIFVGNVIPAVT